MSVYYKYAMNIAKMGSMKDPDYVASHLLGDLIQEYNYSPDLACKVYTWVCKKWGKQ